MDIWRWIFEDYIHYKLSYMDIHYNPWIFNILGYVICNLHILKMDFNVLYIINPWIFI